MSDNSGHEMNVFTEAVKISRDDRPTFLDIACREDKELRRKIEALLSSHDRLGNFLEQSPMRKLSDKQIEARLRTGIKPSR